MHLRGASMFPSPSHKRLIIKPIWQFAEFENFERNLLRARVLAEQPEFARPGENAWLEFLVCAGGVNPSSARQATACADTGLRGIVFLEVFGEGDAQFAERFEPMRDRVAPSLSGDVTLGISPHAPYTVGLDLYRACDELGLPVATHLAESESETRFLRDGSGPWEAFSDWLVPPPGTTGIRMLEEAGLLGPHVLAAHCVQADAEEIEILAARNVAVAHCPRSNALLGCGVAPLHDLRAAGVRVCIATDLPSRVRAT